MTVIWQAPIQKIPTPSFTAYMLSKEIPFEFNMHCEIYMPCVLEQELPRVFWAWLPPLVEKIKEDLKALERWDRWNLKMKLI